MTGHELLSVEEMYRADAAAIAGGVPGLELMEAAGGAIVRETRTRWQTRPVTILCGPGNNGGDGFVAARLLSKAGWPVCVGLLGSPEKLKDDAAVNAARWTGGISPLGPELLDGDPLVIDALFGAGLGRPLAGMAGDLIETVNARNLDCVGVDIPSGVHGDSGAVLGTAPRCRVTVTFFRPKPGHMLLPGRDRCGEVVVADIGIPESVLEDIAPATAPNHPSLWLGLFPWPDSSSHKYTRGHAVVVGGARMTGAARLAAAGARRAGAGLLTIAAPPEAATVYRSGEPGVLVHDTGDTGAFDLLLRDRRRNAVLVGPGCGVEEITRERSLAALQAGKAVVLDADALTVFANAPETLFAAIGDAPCVLTPHEGEFARLFPDLIGDCLTRARAAAAASGAVVLLKGPDTVVAAPNGRAAITGNAPAWLATGGTGDVLAGLVLGLLAQGMPAFEAVCMAAWMHGEAAKDIGPGLIAEDLSGAVPRILKRLRALSSA